ncbi:MAG TPA: hypothetical protein DCS93_05595 [Microscillaceae bacterium]|nr:hypothetical protein [Microscillaceae bacterium]
MFKQIYTTLLLAGITFGVYAQNTQPDYKALRNQLEAIYKTDQGVRKDFMKVFKKGPKDPAYKKLIKQMKQVDEKNLRQVTALLDKYGWLPYSKVGEMAGNAQFLVIQHANLKMMQKYLPQMKKMAAKNEASKYNVALMEDRVLMNLGKKQIYGSQARSLFKKGATQSRLFIWPIEDVQNVNKRRKAMGFTRTVEQQAKDMGAEFDPNEPLPEKKKKEEKKN